MIARARTILAASSVALLALSAGSALAQEAPPTDEAPRARQMAPDRPLRQGEGARARDDAAPGAQRGPRADRPGFDIERLKQYLDANPEAKRELMLHLRQQTTDRPLGQGGPQADRPMQGQGRGLERDGQQPDRQRLRQFMQNHPEARQRLLEFQEQHPEARGRMGEFLEAHPNAMRRLMQSQEEGPFHDRNNNDAGRQFDGQRGRQFLQDGPDTPRGPLTAPEQGPSMRRGDRGLQQQPQMRGQRQGRMQQMPQMRGQRQGRMQQMPQMQGQRQGRMQQMPQMRGQRQGRMQQQPQMQGQRQGRMQRQMDGAGVCPHCNQPMPLRQMQQRPQRSFRGQPDRPLPQVQPQARRRAQ